MPWPPAVFINEAGQRVRVCRSCWREKPLSDFYVRRNGSPKSRCKPCTIAERKKYAGRYSLKRKAEIQRRCNLKVKFGLSPEDYDRMLMEQQGKCAICGNDHCGRKDQKNFAVDHDHQTGQIRGLLCGRCNTALGSFDTLEKLSRAIEYLRAGQQSTRFVPAA